MTNSNVDKKIGRKKAGTWGRTSGGYSPAAAKQSKRAGSKGARKVAKQELRVMEGDKYSPENIAKQSPEWKAKEKAKTLKKLKKVAPWMAKGLEETVIKKKGGGTIMVKQSFLDSLQKTHPKDHARLIKKMKNMPRPVKEAKDYSDSKKNHYNLYADKNDHHKAHNEIHAAVTHKSGNPKHMNKAMEKHSKHGATDTASREEIVSHFMKHHADKKGKTWHVKEWVDTAGHGEDPNDATPPAKLTSSEKKKLAAQTKKFKNMRAGEFAKAHGNQWKKMAKKEAIEYLDIPEGYIGRLADGNKKLMQKDSEKHDTGGFRISDAEAKKAKARLKKKYGKFARHFREFNDLQELSPKTIRSYQKKAGKQYRKIGYESGDSINTAELRGHISGKEADKRYKDQETRQKRGQGLAASKGKGKIKEGYFKRIVTDRQETERLKSKKLDPKKATKKQIRAADARGEIGTKGKLQELSPKTLHNYMTKRLSQTPPHDMDSKQHKDMKRAGDKIFKKEYSKTGKPIKDKKGKTVGLVHEEQKRVIESLANLTSRGIDHKPIQKKKSKIDPGKAVRKAAAERLQKTAKARIRGTTSRQKFGEAYPVYKTKDYLDRQDKGWKSIKLAKPKPAKKKHVSAPSMKNVKDTMWGKGKHSTKKPYAEGTFTQQFEPEYTEGKQRVKNAIRAKLGLKKGPQGDWKKEMKMRHAREKLIKSFRKESFVIGKDGTRKDRDNYHKDMAKGYGDSPKMTPKDLDKMAKHYSKKKKIKEDAASGRPIKKPVKKIKKKDSGKDGSFVFTSPKSNVIGSYSLRNKIGARMGLKPIIAETAEYKAAMGPGSHEWGTDIGRDYFKKLTPGQDNPPEDPIKPLDIKARKPQDEKGVKVTENKGFDLDGINPKQAEYTKDQYPIDNEVDARWASNVDGILTGAYEGGEITWEDVIALDKEAENITFDQEVEMGLYDPEELEANDFDGDPLNDTAILEVLSVTGRMKRRFNARRNRQKLKVARAIALRRGSTPDRIKRRATRGARLMVYKRLLRGRSRGTLPPAEKARLEKMITRFQPLVNRIAVKLGPQIRKNEIKRMGNRGKRTATVSKKYKAAKPIRGAASQKAKRYKIKKPGKYKAPKPKQYRMRGASGGPTIKRASKAYKAFSYSVG